jgi:DoxX-like family
MASVPTLSSQTIFTPPPASTAKRISWPGRIVSAVPVLFLVFDAVIKLFKIPAVDEAFQQMGWPVSAAVGIGVLELICVALYVIPQTAVLGVIVLTGYLGGAVATHVRVGDPLFSHVLFPVYVALLLWGGLFLREQRLRALVPFRS